jgi:iron complex outermembrane receptor protein
MKSVSGVYLKRSKFGDTTTSVNIRGFSGSRRNLVLFNGMPLNDGYSTAVDWSGISSESIDTIEIVKGPFSSLYGRNAMGGVINMITTTPGKQEVSVKTGYGTHNTYTGSVSYGDRLFNSLGILLSGNYASTDGHRSNLVRTSFATGTTGTPVTGMEPDTDTTGSPVVTSGSTAGQPYFPIGDKGKNYFERWGSTGKIDYDITSNSEISYTFNVQDYKYGYRDARSYLKNANGSSVSSGAVTFNYNGINYSKTIYQNTFLDGPGENFSHLHLLDYSLKSDVLGLSAKAGYSSSEKWYTTPNTGSTGADFSGGPGKVSRTDPKRTLYTDVQGDYYFAGFMTVTLGGGTRYDTAENDEFNITDWKDPDSETGLPSDHVSDMKGKQFFSSAYSQVELTFLKSTEAVSGGKI